MREVKRESALLTVLSSNTHNTARNDTLRYAADPLAMIPAGKSAGIPAGITASGAAALHAAQIIHTVYTSVDNKHTPCHQSNPHTQLRAGSCRYTPAAADAERVQADNVEQR